ncbi:MAG: hypothetical protein KBS81_11335 [Spirochaetales bacterium]|nr:hypothetical protein [Candidatus Physcosoma equi]
MKRVLFLLLVVFMAIVPAFAVTDYSQIAFSYGFNENLIAPSLGFHAQYQFGISFSEDFDFGFGSFADLDFALSDKNGYDTGFSLLIGPGFSVKENPQVITSVLFGPQIDIYENTYDIEDIDRSALGFGASLSYTFIPLAEQNSRVQMGFTLGGIASALWNEEQAFTPSFKAYFGVTLKTPVWYMADHDFYDEIVWYGINM